MCRHDLKLTWTVSLQDESNYSIVQKKSNKTVTAVRGWQSHCPTPGESASLGPASGFHVHTGHQALIGHQQLSDTVGLYGVFLHTREPRQFRRGKGHRSKSQNTKN